MRINLTNVDKNNKLQSYADCVFGDIYKGIDQFDNTIVFSVSLVNGTIMLQRYYDSDGKQSHVVIFVESDHDDLLYMERIDHIELYDGVITLQNEEY